MRFTPTCRTCAYMTRHVVVCNNHANRVCACCPTCRQRTYIGPRAPTCRAPYYINSCKIRAAHLLSLLCRPKFFEGSRYSNAFVLLGLFP